jgi:anaerobic dimethyl sulfoxide reductase subunit A
MWGWSPGDGHFGTSTFEYLKWARKNGTRIVCVDPRVTHTSLQLADEHVLIRPSTDSAMLIAMAYVVVTEGLHDAEFCGGLVLGLDEAHLPPGAPPGSSWRSYLLGLSDGVRKTPEWAEPITGVPAATIRRLAMEFATVKPAATHCGYAPGRMLYGEQFHHAAYSLAAITGNVGIFGGNSGLSGGSKLRISGRFTSGRNPGRPAGPGEGRRLPRRHQDDLVGLRRPRESMRERQQDGGRGAAPDTTRCSCVRRSSRSGSAGMILDICADLAQRLGIEGYNDKTEEAWLREFCAGTEIGDFEAFREQGLARLPAPDDAVGFAREVRDPQRHPFSTPSGKIEVYSTSIAANPDMYGLGAIAVVPTYIHPYDDDPRQPLLMVTPKSRARTHSIHDNQETLARADRQDVWLHPDDAAARGIADGAKVRVFNQRGATILPVRVTDRIVRGVVSLKEGAWFTPDAEGRDTRGCANVLTADRSAPSGASTYNTCQVEVEPAP